MSENELNIIVNDVGADVAPFFEGNINHDAIHRQGREVVTHFSIEGAIKAPIFVLEVKKDTEKQNNFIVPGSTYCLWEGVGKRPDPGTCTNNPVTHPENHRPGICEQCPTNELIHKVADLPLPPIYIKDKQNTV